MTIWLYVRIEDRRWPKIAKNEWTEHHDKNGGQQREKKFNDIKGRDEKGGSEWKC